MPEKNTKQNKTNNIEIKKQTKQQKKKQSKKLPKKTKKQVWRPLEVTHAYTQHCLTSGYRRKTLLSK